MMRVVTDFARSGWLASMCSVGVAACTAPLPASPPPSPGVYGFGEACARVPFEELSSRSGWEWCIDAATVSEDGDLELLASWTMYGGGFARVETILFLMPPSSLADSRE